MEIKKSLYFKRQTTLKEIGETGQKKLQEAKVLIIGCGGLGSPIAIYLATSGVGELHLVDFDKVSVSNLHRQVFFKIEDVALSKVEVLSNEISKRAPFTKVTYTDKAVDKKSIRKLISHYDLVVDGTDNLTIKYLINDACVLEGKPLVYGSLYKFDGYVASFNLKQADGSYSCNLRDAFPKIARDIPNCEEAGTLNPIVGIIALLQVNEAIKIITGTGKPILNELLIYNALANSQFKLKLNKNLDLNFEEIFANATYLDANCEIQDSELLITARELKDKLKDKSLEIISVSNDMATPHPFKVHTKVPYTSFRVENLKPDPEKTYVVVCNKGITSYSATLRIKRSYPDLKVFSLQEGIEKFEVS
jgi:adenylyltransferase/sulfurtransferase